MSHGKWRPMLIQCCFTESNKRSTNILVVNVTAHTGMKETHAKITSITLASFDIYRSLEMSLKENEDEER